MPDTTPRARFDAQVAQGLDRTPRFFELDTPSAYAAPYADPRRFLAYCLRCPCSLRARHAASSARWARMTPRPLYRCTGGGSSSWSIRRKVRSDTRRKSATCAAVSRS